MTSIADKKLYFYQDGLLKTNTVDGDYVFIVLERNEHGLLFVHKDVPVSEPRFVFYKNVDGLEEAKVDTSPKNVPKEVVRGKSTKK